MEQASRPPTPLINCGLHQQCQRCGKAFDRQYIPRCDSCQGLVEILYDLKEVQLYESARTSVRFADLLPVVHRRQVLDLGEGQTDCIHAKKLGRLLGLDRLFLKMERQNPTGTTKDRMAAAVLSMFNELGIKEFISSSTGNSSTALARGIRLHPFCKMHLYVGGEFRSRVRNVEGNPGVEVHTLEGKNFTEAFNHARDESRLTGLPFEAGFFNPARREGLKLAFFEAVEQIGTSVDWYFQAVSSAMGVHGTWKGAQELLALGCISQLPRLVCVQQESCCPMVKAFAEGSPEIQPHHIVPHPAGIAKAILRGNPSGCYPHMWQVVTESKGDFVAVSEKEIRAAQACLQETEQLECGYCSAATVAAVAKLAASDRMARHETTLLNLTD